MRERALFFNEKSEIILSDWEILSISVKDEDKAMSHAVEDGGQITDWRVRQLTEVSVQVGASGEALQSAWRELTLLRINGELVTLATKNALHKNLLLLGRSYDNKPDVWDAVLLTLTLKEIRTVTPKHTSAPVVRKPKAAKSASTVQRGKVEAKTAEGGKAAGGRKKSAIASWLN